MSCFLYLFFWLAAILLLVKLWVKLTTGWCKSNECLVGKTAIITGGNSGIGYETAADFAKRGAKVILACRNQDRGKDAVTRVIRETDNPNIIFKQLDLSSFKSIRQFAEDINRSEERLDILVNNSGILGIGEEKSEDGLLLTMQTNYFGPFLLTNLLLDLIKRTPNSRVVNVASLAAAFGDIDVNNLNQGVPKGFQERKIYARSKLCNIIFTIELAERLKGTTITTYSLHPGAVHTELFTSMPAYMKYITINTIRWFFKDSLEGAQTTIYCSVEKGIEHLSGQHFHDCHPVGKYRSARSLDLPKKLWQVSEKLVRLNEKLN